MGITINLMKPKKDPKQVLAEKEQSDQGKYPKCALCLENLGYSGSLTHPARQTLRYIPITLNGEDWHCNIRLLFITMNIASLCRISMCP